MNTIRYFLLGLLALVTLTATTLAQPTTTVSDLHEGVYFEVAYGVVWASPTERPLPQPLLLLLSSRYKTRCTVFNSSDRGSINKVYNIEANKVLRIAVQTPYLSLTEGGIVENGITITSEAPITVSTYIAYSGNGNMTLHYPVTTWGKSYHVFSNPQDEYATGANRKRRPGQIVILAAEDNTFVTINSPVRIAKSSDHAAIAANTPVTVELEAHETLTLLSEIDTAKSHTASTNLTGTRITSTKPVAVMSGHTKGAVGLTYPLLPPTGMFAAEAHFIRNNYHQSLLHDAMADTAFVTVPMMYTATRRVFDEKAGDVVRILALQSGTVVRRSRLDGSGDVTVATLDSGRTYTDTVVTDAYKWKSTKPVLVMQYGKSYANVLPPGGETPTPVVKDFTSPQGHPTVVSGMPTMMVVPGTSQWIERGTFYAPEGMDNFLSIVVKTQDVGSIFVDGVRPKPGPWAGTIPGTDLSYVRIAVPTGDRRVTTEPAAKFMAWNYGSLDGLAQGRAYGHPIGVNMTRACVDSIVGYADRFEPYARANARITLGAECSSVFRHEVLSSTNAFIDSVSYYPNIFDPDSLSVYVLKTNVYEVGLMTVRFTSTGGKTVDVDLTLPATPLPPRPQHYVHYEIAAAKRYDTIVASVILDSAINTQFTKCHVHLRYNTHSIRLVTPFTFDSSSGTEHTSRFLMPITSNAAGTVLGKVLFVYQTPDPFASIFPMLTRITWFKGTVEQTNVDLHLRTVIIDTIPDTTQVDVEDEVATAGYTGPTLALSPQPAHDIVSITYRMAGFGKGQQGGALRAGSDAYTLRVYDYTGTLVMDLSEKLVGDEGTMYLSTQGLSRGMYVLQLSNSASVFVTRLLVE